VHTYLVIFGVLVLGLVAYWLVKKSRARREGEAAARRFARRSFILEHGKRGEAKILSVQRTGMSINDQPEIRFTMEFDLQDGRVLEIKAERIVDILEIPRVQPGGRVPVAYHPQNPMEFEILWEELAGEKTGAGAGFSGSGEEPVSSTGATFDCPLWLFGMRSAETWLFPPRPGDAQRLVVVDFTDSLSDKGDQKRDWIVDSAAFIMAEAFWALTDMPATAAVMVNVEKRKLLNLTGHLMGFEELKPFTASLDYDPVVAWGAAGLDLEKDGLTLKVRLPGESSDRTMTAPLAELTDMLVSFLAGRGLCRRVDGPGWYSLPGPEQVPYYAVLLHNLQLQILADKKNKVLPELDRELSNDFVDLALDMCRDHGGRMGQLGVVMLTTAYYASRAGHLDPKMLARAMEVLVAVKDKQDPVYRLSPRYLREFGRGDGALERQRELSGSAGPAFDEWLKRALDDDA
jgi:Arc/MetJ family transcription regulator